MVDRRCRRSWGKHDPATRVNTGIYTGMDGLLLRILPMHRKSLYVFAFRRLSGDENMS